MAEIDGDDKTRLACVAIGALAVIECIALIMGIDGAMMTLIIGAIAAIAAGTIGYKVGINRVEVVLEDEKAG